MSSDAAAPRPEPLRSYSCTDTYDSGSRLIEVRETVRGEGAIDKGYACGPEPQNPTFQFVHDQDKGLFVLTWPDGRVERFRDRPARQLMVEPDRQTGAIRPVIKWGQPVYVYLCREEREQV